MTVRIRVIGSPRLGQGIFRDGGAVHLHVVGAAHNTDVCGNFVPGLEYKKLEISSKRTKHDKGKKVNKTNKAKKIT